MTIISILIAFALCHFIRELGNLRRFEWLKHVTTACNDKCGNVPGWSGVTGFLFYFGVPLLLVALVNFVFYETLGDLGALVNVKPGFARNYLIPQGMATIATEENKVEFENRRSELEQAALEKLTEAEQRYAALDGQQIEIAGKASEEGKLFGSVGVIDIANAMTEKGVHLEKSEVRLPDGPIKMVGEYQVLVHIHTGVECEIEVSVVPE